MILTACEGLDAQLVLSLGGNMDPAGFLGRAGNPIVVKFAPQLELLEQAALCITHAGLNTALESLAWGVPMVAIPITNDQPGVAARITWCGVGEFVTPRRLTRSSASCGHREGLVYAPVSRKRPAIAAGDRRSALTRLCQRCDRGGLLR